MDAPAIPELDERARTQQPALEAAPEEGVNRGSGELPPHSAANDPTQAPPAANSGVFWGWW